MLTLHAIFFALAAVFLASTNPSHATIMCFTCPTFMSINITTDEDLNTNECGVQEKNTCSLSVQIDYMNSNDTFFAFGGILDGPLTLTNGELQVVLRTSIWFNKYRVQRAADASCFSGSNCGLDVVKKIYREELRTFDYQTIQNGLATQLYSSTAVSSTLTCADPSGNSVACTDGFCRSIFDGNGLVSYSSCVKKGIVEPAYGLLVTKTVMSDFGGDNSNVMYSCNKPMCNSPENTRQVLQQLVASRVLPQPTGTTTTPPKGVATPLLNNRQHGLLLSLLMLFVMVRFEK